ncbi:hypothetical protein CSIM01_06708 [Colletotrichum simmondsii]|uniref:C2H2-type domain-containing protein n=1 Tax=Colletotrichum simmondsii TaxID=703756 RepID=A0A135SUP7_9PEZI|nr:hypothetical protein CSIM01_06708 [Colletotrichum simmondsii]
MMRQVAHEKAQAQDVDVPEYMRRRREVLRRSSPQKFSRHSRLYLERTTDVSGRCSPVSETRANSDAGSLASRMTWESFQNGDISSNSADLDERVRTDESHQISEDREVEELPSQSQPPAPKQDAPFTDSGYASGINADNLPRWELQDSGTSSCNRNDLNTRTVYSGGSTVAIDQEQRYIFELSSTIHYTLGRNIDADDWKSLSKHLLGLIKDFAIQLGLESSVQVNRDIMHFIHKRGREITKQLESMILNVDTSAEDADENNEAEKDSMPLSDKMDLWTSKATETETSVDDNELFVGVTEVEESIDAAELSKYNKIITESNSFKWLIESLRRELTLMRDFGESGGCDYRETLRRKVIENLPTGKISKTRPPNIHFVTFRVPGWELLSRAEVDRDGSESPLCEAIVVTCCSGDAQAAAIEDYMEQTWPSTWKTISNLLQKASLGQSGSVHADTLHDKTKVSASSEYGNLILSLEGPAHTIAECGEQLAWLRASCANTPSHHVMGNILQLVPVIKETNTLHGRTFFDIGVEKHIPGEFALLEQFRWTELHLLRNNNVVLIPGYPILRRPKTFNGIEVSSRFLLNCLKEVFASSFDISLEDILSGRHIIGKCQEFSLDVDESVPALGRESQFNDNGIPCPSASSSLVMETRGAESPNSTASSWKLTREIEDMEIVSSLLQGDDVNSGDSCQQADGIHPCVSTESSLESDLLSMSDSSEELESLPDDDPIRAVLDNVVSRLVSGFRYALGGEVLPCSSGRDHGTTASSSSRGNAASSGPTRKDRKGKQVQNDGSDSEEDATHPRPSKRSRKTQQHIKLLACPFGKMSPSKYSACSRFQLKRIRDVKQHLKRKHTPDDYCNRCLSIFDDEESLTQHVSQPDGFGCQLAPEGRTLDGITHRQSRDLSRKANAEVSEEQQWFAIWDIVFPRKPRPESAYLDSAFAMQICLFREHCARHAEPLLAQNLRAAGLLDERRVAADQEQLLRRVIAESLDSVCDTFSTNTSSDSGIGRSRNSTRNETPAASLVDSGIGIGSHFQPRTAAFATASNSQQNTHSGPTGLPQEFQTLVSEEGTALGLQAFANLHQPESLGQSSTVDFPIDHDLPSAGHMPDDIGMFDFNLSTDLPSLELSSWTFPQTEITPHEAGVENAI